MVNEVDKARGVASSQRRQAPMCRLVVLVTRPSDPVLLRVLAKSLYGISDT